MYTNNTFHQSSSHLFYHGIRAGPLIHLLRCSLRYITTYGSVVSAGKLSSASVVAAAPTPAVAMPASSPVALTPVISPPAPVPVSSPLLRFPLRLRLLLRLCETASFASTAQLHPLEYLSSEHHQPLLEQ